jgi:hypothetical protein
MVRWAQVSVVTSEYKGSKPSSQLNAWWRSRCNAERLAKDGVSDTSAALRTLESMPG